MNMYTPGNFYQPQAPQDYMRNPYTPSVMQTPPAQPPVVLPPQNSNGLIWVQGEAAAKSYPIGRGQSVLLMNSEQDTFFLKTMDESGMPLPLRVFEYHEITAPTQRPKTATEAPSASGGDYITREEFNAFVERLEAKNSKRAKVAKEEEHNAE